MVSALRGPIAKSVGEQDENRVSSGMKSIRALERRRRSQPAYRFSSFKTPAPLRSTATSSAARRGAGGPLLEVKGVCSGYGQARVPRGVDLSIAECQIVAILLANSAGKTILARTICCEIVTT